MQPEYLKKMTFKITLAIILIILTMTIIARVKPLVKSLGDLLQFSVLEIAMGGGNGKLEVTSQRAIIERILL